MITATLERQLATGAIQLADLDVVYGVAADAAAGFNARNTERRAGRFAALSVGVAPL